MRASNWVTCPGSVYLAASSIHGRGVFAARRFEPGAVIEECPVLAVTADQAPLLDETDLFGFTFEWEDGVAVALGFGSLYNHAWTPNRALRPRLRAGPRDLSSRRAIDPGTEITVNYSGDPAGQIDLWFDT